MTLKSFSKGGDNGYIGLLKHSEASQSVSYNQMETARSDQR